MKNEIRRRRNYHKLGFWSLGIFVAVFLFAFLAHSFKEADNNASAANLANFQAGYIISDFQMTDYGSMSEADIQSFLWSKGRCYNTNFSGVGTRVDYFSDHTPPTTWHVKDGHTVCLAEENINGESAAHIIWQAAQDYQINPKVLIVLIQKETGLITDPIPNSWDYQRTAGYGCPDTAACSEKYYGFKNQIRNAAQLFRIVMDGNSSYYPIGNNNVRYSPNPDCGSSIVYIKNLATSALYRYTPYQPNAGALAAGYGTAPCGAYGNRNFYAYFEDWFGGATWEEYNPTNDINKVYIQHGGEDGILGRKISGYKKNNASGIYWIEYEHGYIVGNKEHGYYISIGKIRDVWSAQNWEFGPLGFPISTILTNKESGIEFQQYEHGYIVGNKEHGYYISTGAIRNVWANYNFELGPLGFPVSNILTNPASGIEFQQYEHGYIVGNKSHGYYISMGEIRDVWSAQNWEFGPLGFPISAILTNKASGIEYQQYEHGYIVGNKSHGYYISMGKIRDVWSAQNWEFGPLGFPTSNIIEDGDRRYQRYEGGIIMGTSKSRYYISIEDIYKVWVENGAENGALGLPITNVLTNKTSGIEFQQYEHGYIVGNKEHGYYISIGKIRDVWSAQNWEFGPLGFPISTILTNKESGIEFQQYEHGYIVGNKEHGYYISTGAIRNVWANYNFELGPLGFPVSNILTNPASGIEFQQYEHGYIVGNKSHGYYISMGEIRDVWSAQNWEFGPLGFPTSNIIEDGDRKYQQYEGGKIIYTAERGAWIE